MQQRLADVGRSVVEGANTDDILGDHLLIS
jgi:hypothetical protein